LANIPSSKLSKKKSWWHPAESNNPDLNKVIFSFNYGSYGSYRSYKVLWLIQGQTWATMVLMAHTRPR
jgi:hypothetical protein